ncbi:hypothetical protein [Candidatus Thiosymbion oneisti]|uniref:hypothetical protein n=1 Tax=Candidatus Thiosymbion oneisti TaxID=589554 RepID=UPI00210DC002|nr:hypothetical protein [Candidatus Thiosymbion oneisti]
MDEIIELNTRLLDTVRREGFAGYDPFDLLNSHLLQSSPLYGNEWVRLAWLQFGKRSPINFRPVLGVPKRRNPKGVGLFILGLLQDYHRTGETGYLCEPASWPTGC